MVDPTWKLVTKFEKVLDQESYLGTILKAYKDQNNPIFIKMKDENGEYTRNYRHSDVLSKAYVFSQMHEELDINNVAFISENHIDIIAVEVGCLIRRKYTTGFYRNDSIGDISFKIVDAQVNMVIVDQSGLEKIKALQPDIKSHLKMVLLIEGTTMPEDKTDFPPLLPLELPSDESKVELIRPINDPDVSNDIVKVVYTSGSTGKPKGVPLSNKNCHYASYGYLHDMFCGSEERERTAFFFPNAHIFQSACVGLAYTGAFIGYISSKETFKEDLLKIKPTYLFGVPLLFQKIAQQVELKLTSMLGGFFKEKDLIGPTWKNRLFIGPIFRKILRKKLGFSSMKTLFCAGAALNSKTYDFYKYTFGFKVTSGYGLSETTGPLTSDPIGIKGASGKTSVNNTIEIRNKNEEGVGDVWAKGGNIFDGYLNDSEKNYFDDQGFFETGDRGYFDDDGFIYIVGRIKNQHKAADGRFYNIEAIAEKVLSKAHHIQQVAIHILNAQFPTALITLGEDRLDFEEYKNNDEFLEKLQAECFEIIDHLKKDHYYPIPKKFILTPPFTEDNGLLTPTKKIKVLKVLSLYDKVIESFSKKDGTEFLVFTDH